MTDDIAFHCEAKLHGFRKTADGVVVSFVLHPSQVPQQLALADLGCRYMLAMAQIGDNEQPIIQQPTRTQVHPTSPAKQRYEQMKDAEQMVARAGMFANDPIFRDWAAKQKGVEWIGENETAQFIRDWCGVQSRRDIPKSTESYRAFLDMERQYMTDVGR